MARPKSATIDLKVRMKEPLRARIERAAKHRGVSLNAEIVDRVEKSFQQEDALGGPELVGLFQMMAGAVAIIEARTSAKWTSDWETSVAVRVAWRKLMSSIAVEPTKELDDLTDAFDHLPQKPIRPEIPVKPKQYSGLLRQSPPPTPDQIEAYESELSAFNKADDEFHEQVETYVRQFEKIVQQRDLLRKRMMQYGAIGEETAESLFPPHKKKK